jgi:hypothetical protein
MAKKELNKKLIIGETYFFQTCTKDWVGRLVSIDGPYTIVLEDASWVAESGRLHLFVKNGKADGMEIEPVGVVSCQWVNWIPWPHSLFKESV